MVEDMWEINSMVVAEEPSVLIFYWFLVFSGSVSLGSGYRHIGPVVLSRFFNAPIVRLV
jgi:hypothetical protein